MAKKMKEQFIDMGKVESEKSKPTEELKSAFDEMTQLGLPRQLMEKLRQHTSTSPTLSGGDGDAAWKNADVGVEPVGNVYRPMTRASWKRWGKQ